MKYRNILHEVAQLMEINVSDLDLNAKLVNYGNWDSLVIVSTIAIIDQECGVLLKGCDIEGCNTLNRLFELIEERQNARAVA